MESEQKSQILAYVEMCLDDHSARCVASSPPIEVAPENGWRCFKSSGTTYLLIATGPLLDRETEAKHLLQRDVKGRS